jgi:hypothetical protein
MCSAIAHPATRREQHLRAPSHAKAQQAGQRCGIEHDLQLLSDAAADARIVLVAHRTHALVPEPPQRSVSDAVIVVSAAPVMLFAKSLAIAPDAHRLFVSGGSGSPLPTARMLLIEAPRRFCSSASARNACAGALRCARCGRSLEQCETGQQRRAATPAARQGRPHRQSCRAAPRTWDQSKRAASGPSVGEQPGNPASPARPMPVMSNAVGYMCTMEQPMPLRLTHGSDVPSSSNDTIRRFRYR